MLYQRNERCGIVDTLEKTRKVIRSTDSHDFERETASFHFIRQSTVSQGLRRGWGAGWGWGAGVRGCVKEYLKMSLAVEVRTV